MALPAAPGGLAAQTHAVRRLETALGVLSGWMSQVTAGAKLVRLPGGTMSEQFPSAVPEIRVSDVARAAVYYENCLGFHWDWGVDGLGQVSRGDCRIFLTDNAFRGDENTGTPVVIWLNLNSKAEVDELFAHWKAAHAKIIAEPEDKPWKLREFMAADLDGNLIRVFYDFRGDM